MQLFDLQHSCGEQGQDSLSMDQALQQLQDMGFRYHSVSLHAIEVDTPDDEIIEANREQVASLMDEDGYEFVEVIRLTTTPKASAAYIYKSERDVLETRLITHGKCSMFIRFNGQILELQSNPGDLIRMPGQLCYWIEAGIHDCHYIHLYSTDKAWDKVTAQHDSHPCALSNLQEAS